MTSADLSRRATGPLAPLLGIAIGAAGGAIYWVGVQIWPSNVALILSMAVTALLITDFRAAGETHAVGAARLDPFARVLLLLIKFNALMALSASQLPFAVPANLSLPLIMICGYAASFALLAIAKQLGHGTSVLALSLGFAPALLLGIPGLIGLGSAVIVGLGAMALLKKPGSAGAGDTPALIQLSTEAGFYLGALASWRFV